MILTNPLKPKTKKSQVFSGLVHVICVFLENDMNVCIIVANNIRRGSYN